MRKSYLSVVGLSALFLITGCDKFIRKQSGNITQKIVQEFGIEKKEDVPTAPPPETPPTVPTAMSQPVAPLPAEVSDESLIQKLNGYIECLNRSSPRTHDSYRRYLLWVSERGGPTCKEMNIYGLYSLYEDGVEKCNRAADRGRSMPPSLPQLEEAAADVAAAYAGLIPLVSKANDYYQQQDYKDDQCAKGREMHPLLIAAFQRYFKARARLEAGVDSLKGEADQRELKRLELSQGRRLPWYSKNLMISARNLIEALPKENTLLFNRENYLGRFARLEKDYQDFSDYTAAHPEEGKGVFWFGAFESGAKNFYTQAKFLKRDLAEGKPPAPRGLNEVLNNYNRLIQDSNNLRF